MKADQRVTEHYVLRWHETDNNAGWRLIPQTPETTPLLELSRARQMVEARGLRQCMMCRLIREPDGWARALPQNSVAAVMGVPTFARYVCNVCDAERRERQATEGEPSLGDLVAKGIALIALQPADQAVDLTMRLVMSEVNLRLQDWCDAHPAELEAMPLATWAALVHAIQGIDPVDTVAKLRERVDALNAELDRRGLSDPTVH